MDEKWTYLLLGAGAGALGSWLLARQERLGREAHIRRRARRRQARAMPPQAMPAQPMPSQGPSPVNGHAPVPMRIPGQPMAPQANYQQPQPVSTNRRAAAVASGAPPPPIVTADSSQEGTLGGERF